MHPPRRRRWPVPPSLLVGLVPIVVFAAVSAWRSRPSDDYATLGQTVDSVVRALVVPEGIAVVALAVFVTALGWWRIATVDRTRTPLRWTMVAPLLIVLVALARLPFVDWSALPPHYFLLLTVGVLFVGVFEELMTRGVLLVGLRRRVPEIGVWAISCALFGVLHLLNVLGGAEVDATLLQVVFAASFGSTLYVARRLTGNLLAPVLLHAFWDFGSIGFSATAGFEDRGRLIAVGLIGLFSFAVLVLGIVAGALVAWRDDRPRRLAKQWRSVPPMAAFALEARGTASVEAPAGLASR
ncbi:CPBP family intramembrane metalloprotease [Curtobacterium sp. MCLR17_036]|uniref:CPBP family intramembrane glutamic endopeptidase n=1 Tax=Curtobacterium sp. MCLR17_036 TaxID=2175620 RepID=UPI0024DF3A73|nr:CPBP family intramembrane glutamic endopeptidase [Curtobacterium sp. MCLR17_036]WIE65379.1 CPBP family intramembrane metalloprotease [Curtobacterium sp. MCLR17_036]